jgi:hypothetical protein
MLIVTVTTQGLAHDVVKSSAMFSGGKSSMAESFWQHEERRMLILCDIDRRRVFRLGPLRQSVDSDGVSRFERSLCETSLTDS